MFSLARTLFRPCTTTSSLSSTCSSRHVAAALGVCSPTLLSSLDPVAAATTQSQKRWITIDIDINKKKKRKRIKERRDSGRASYRFIDKTRVQVTGGPGGKGSVAMFRIGRKHKKRPDGGNGGHGGSVIIVADDKEHSLRWTHPHVLAEAGTAGGSQAMDGRNGKNTVLRVPCGVVIRRVIDYDEEWDEENKTVRKIVSEDPTLESDMGDHPTPTYLATDAFSQPRAPYLASNDYDSDEDSDDEEDNMMFPEADFDGLSPWNNKERESVVIADLDQPGSYAVVARGGRGGRGSAMFASYNGPTPPPEVLAKYAEPKMGDSAYLELELKLIADIGLVGFPNAGKSSLLAAMSRATPHIAPYPFTTLNPLVGYIEYRDGFRVCAADIPGLIAGASEGRGRGHDFLRHLERTKALVYMIDVAGTDGRNPKQDLQILVDEVSAYGDGSMLERNALVVANKVDLLDEATRKKVVSQLRTVCVTAGIRFSGEILEISAGVTGEGLSSLSKAIRDVVLLTEQDNKARNSF
eukprot:Nitzschia sp. Nitz4//scaffold57_size113557//15066//16634//NITZ4_003984-RA/size113557-processed-gene-0.4-mRNA-1//1//CDS//3329554825//3454//frame0